MKALSLWQPHAIAIGVGLKLYETRGWQLLPSMVNVPVAIHAAKRVFRERDYEWNYFKEARDRLRAAGVSLEGLDYGKVVCICTFSAIMRTATVRGTIGDAEFWGDFSDVGEDGHERWAFRVEHVRLIPADQRPQVTGRQGFFEVPDEIGLWG
jgi:hypothetical protein